MYDLMARHVIMASLLYYSLDISMFTDAEYDDKCKKVADHFNEIDPVRQWQLGSPEDIRTSGFGVKITVLAASATAYWMQTKGYKQRPLFYRSREWRTDKKNDLRWLGASEFYR